MVDHLHAIKMIVRKTTEHRVTTHLAFIDSSEAFNLFDHTFMLMALLNRVIRTTLELLPKVQMLVTLLIIQ